jgi:phosphoribosyl 1,2-cyclic phosphodiesterase
MGTSRASRTFGQAEAEESSLRFRALGSGSSGNATLVEAGSTRLLIDAGLGPRSLAERLQAAGIEPESLTAVLISHEHSDHSAGAASFSHRFGVEIAGTRGTYAAAGFGSVDIAGYRVLKPLERAVFGGIEVLPVPIPHDAAEPVAFVLSGGGASFGHATDLGHIPTALVEAFAPCGAILIESNYDPGLLRDGPYPWSLKERILSGSGHLSNGDTASYLRRLGRPCRTVALAHLSRTNNHPDLALLSAHEALRQCGRTDVQVELLPPSGGAWISVQGASGQLSLF